MTGRRAVKIFVHTVESLDTCSCENTGKKAGLFDDNDDDDNNSNININNNAKISASPSESNILSKQNKSKIKTFESNIKDIEQNSQWRLCREIENIYH